MTIEVSAFKWVPPFAQGYVRDLRIRWALEEAGIAYDALLLDFETAKGPNYRRRQPFGQVPAYRDGEVDMFESGAIVLHVAGKSEALMPGDASGRARTTSWVLAALNSVEQHAQNYATLDSFHPDEAWVAGYRPVAEKMIAGRLADLSAWLGERDYLEDRFTVGDLIMTTVLRELEDSGMLGRFANLDAYVKRNMARPAFGRAMEAQLKPFRENAPA